VVFGGWRVGSGKNGGLVNVKICGWEMGGRELIFKKLKI